MQLQFYVFLVEHISAPFNPYPANAENIVTS